MSYASSVERRRGLTISYSEFFGLYAISIIIAIYVGLRLTSGCLITSWRPALRFVRHNYGYLVVIAVLPLMVQFVSMLKTNVGGQENLHDSLSNASLIFSIGGRSIASIQSGLDSDLIGSYLAFVYMWVFAFFTYFLPIMLFVKGDKSNIKNYTLAIAVNYAVLIPFYFAFPVAVSSRLPGTDVQPLLYSYSYWGQMATSVDSLTNCFPSGHVSLSFTALLIFALAGREYRRVSYVLGVTAISVAIAVLYLGIHYPADVIGGLLLAFVAATAARHAVVRAAVRRVVDRMFPRRMLHNS